MFWKIHCSRLIDESSQVILQLHFAVPEVSESNRVYDVLICHTLITMIDSYTNVRSEAQCAINEYKGLHKTGYKYRTKNLFD